jgi:hypothetical protein
MVKQVQQSAPAKRVRPKPPQPAPTTTPPPAPPAQPAPQPAPEASNGKKVATPAPAADRPWGADVLDFLYGPGGSDPRPAGTGTGSTAGK